MIRLRPCAVSDFARLTSWIGSAEMLVQWAGPKQFSFPLTQDQLRDYLAGTEGSNPVRKVWAATDDSDQAVGHIELGAIDYDNRTASLCRVLVSPAFQGRGLCLPMVREALRIGFEELGFRRIDLRVYAFNTAAIHCYRRAGFVPEGLLRKATQVGASYWDTMVMGILKEEWKPGPIDNGRSITAGYP